MREERDISRTEGGREGMSFRENRDVAASKRWMSGDMYYNFRKWAIVFSVHFENGTRIVLRFGDRRKSDET